MPGGWELTGLKRREELVPKCSGALVRRRQLALPDPHLAHVLCVDRGQRFVQVGAMKATVGEARKEDEREPPTWPHLDAQAFEAGCPAGGHVTSTRGLVDDHGPTGSGNTATSTVAGAPAARPRASTGVTPNDAVTTSPVARAPSDAKAS